MPNCEIVEVNCSQVVSKKDLLESIARLQNVREDRVPLLFIDEVDSGEFYPLLLAPLWDSEVVIDGHPRRWRERTVSILVASQSACVEEFMENLLDKDESGRKGRDFLSRLNGPTLELSAVSDSEESFTSRVYLAVQMFLRYFPTARVAERGLLDLLYCAPMFNPRTVEHFITTLPRPSDGIVGLKGIQIERLKKFARNLGYLEAEPLQVPGGPRMDQFESLGYEGHRSITLDKLKADHIRLIDSTGRQA